MTGRATFAEVDPIREATLGANIRAAIVYEGVCVCGEESDWRCKKSLEKLE
jgi:hypothetical protein